MKKKETEERLYQIFKQYIGVDYKGNEAIRHEKFLGEHIGLLPEELVFILYEIERNLHIKIPDEVIVSGKFDTFYHIYQSVINLVKD